LGNSDIDLLCKEFRLFMVNLM